jgi:methyltransferase (TIGR00027 family)
MQALVAVRTKVIDDCIARGFADGISQVVVLGAGLDTRPWRIGLTHTPTNVPMQGHTTLESQSWFEIDFPEIFEFKSTALAKLGARPRVRYAAVAADLSLPAAWPAQLAAAGYRPNVPALWLLEGLTGYLTEEELSALVSAITATSCGGSRLLATFIGLSFGGSSFPLHRFKTDSPLAFMRRWGWDGWEAELSHFAGPLSIPVEPAIWAGYRLVDVALAPASPPVLPPCLPSAPTPGIDQDDWQDP